MTPLATIEALATWNAANQRAMEAYAADMSTAAGLCITCDRPSAQGRRECWPCNYARKQAGVAIL